eukprot:TRINITY_DN0_c2978_g1_i2.p1 TRINITY_DN0_c2978_g1~~TRINITY_DN0_c2978_g1_i2.p1  ORF type:complete len:102 (+),score=0.36 TRINITY_DN0_c2978_g1_i2:1-306(+)
MCIRDSGKSLLDTVDIQLKSAQGVDDLMTVLDQMRDTMNAQKETYEHEHQEFQTECAKDIDFYQQEIACQSLLQWIINVNWTKPLKTSRSPRAYQTKSMSK